ncbi:12709_t:CDS:2 [Funneliformis geosporum]|uniref:6704_t:CDS:1 n=1 Tax=Funneliformis geosporum TaxID=1117311 RepID=A0A9W4SG22_9GLOM|nr:12709_t:CDS:2 [Funneliformis geosporum]CAI2168203.1 6704_t:CDS:2 [Funneliformis geosporum]
MGNTPSTNNNNNNQPGLQVTSEHRNGTSPEVIREEPTKPVATGQPIKSSFHDFGSNSPFVGSPLLSHEEYKKFDGYYGNSQDGSLASSFNEIDILTGLSSSSSKTTSSRRSSIVTAEPSYKNSNKIIHDFGSIGGLAPMTSVNAQVKGIPTIITWSQGGNSVFVTGTFNDWKYNVRLNKSTNDFTTVINLPPGTHKLKFIVDDEWKCSNDLSTATEPDGNLVNYLEVYEDDDCNSIEKESLDSDGFLSNSPPGEYSDDIPGYLLAYAHSLSVAENNLKSLDDPFEHQECMAEDQPPTLPPHLEKVILNSSTVSKVDNSVLPVPNHVVLNHLYACSIRDGVIAVAGTTRYRKKHVTTVYYKPIVI